MPRSMEALDLLREAHEVGAQIAIMRAARNRIRRAQTRERELQEVEAVEPKALDTETLRRVKHRAYMLADRKGESDLLISVRLWRVLHRYSMCVPYAINLAALSMVSCAGARLHK